MMMQHKDADVTFAGKGLEALQHGLSCTADGETSQLPPFQTVGLDGTHGQMSRFSLVIMNRIALGPR